MHGLHISKHKQNGYSPNSPGGTTYKYGLKADPWCKPSLHGNRPLNCLIKFGQTYGKMDTDLMFSDETLMLNVKCHVYDEGGKQTPSFKAN